MSNVRCHICNESFGPKGLPIHLGRRHGIHPPGGKGALSSRMKEAIRDLVVMMPPDRFALLRPETNATIDRVLGYKSDPTEPASGVDTA